MNHNGHKEFEFHPVASIFPMMSAAEFEALKKSIQIHCQRIPIYTHEGKIVDGRNRYQACIELGIKPRFEEWDGKGLLVDFVWDLNAERRQLTGGAMQLAAGKYAIEREAEAERRQLAVLRKGDSPSPSIEGDGEFGESARKAAEKFNIGRSTVQRAVKVVKRGAPELVQAVESGQASVFSASHLAELPIEEQKEIVARGGEEIVKTAQDIQDRKRTQKHTSGTSGNGKPTPQKPDEKEIKLQGVGVFRAHEAINCLKRIPKNDGLRKDGFQIVKDWIKHND